VAASDSAPTRTRVLQTITAALVAGCRLSQAGIHPIIPHAMGCHCSDWETAMVRCRATIRNLDPRRDLMVMLDGWENSPGATEERELALSLGLPVVTLAEALGEGA